MKSYIITNGILKEYKGKATRPSIPKDVTEIGTWAFYYCDTITSIKIPSSVTKIDNNAFRICTNLKSVEIPNSVTQIGWGAFTGCKNLTSINIPSNVTRIDDYAFDGCEKLNTVNISNSVSHIGFCAFDVTIVKPQYNSNGTLRAFKAFLNDWTCRGFKYEVGKTYHQDGTIICCCNGFHACTNPLDIFNYYHGDLHSLHFAEVELSGEMDKDFDKVAASDIKIVRELTISELAEIYNNMEKV